MDPHHTSHSLLEGHNIVLHSPLHMDTVPKLTDKDKMCGHCSQFSRKLTSSWLFPGSKTSSTIVEHYLPALKNPALCFWHWMQLSLTWVEHARLLPNHAETPRQRPHPAWHITLYCIAHSSHSIIPPFLSSSTNKPNLNLFFLSFNPEDGIRKTLSLCRGCCLAFYCISRHSTVQWFRVCFFLHVVSPFYEFLLVWIRRFWQTLHYAR